MNILILSSSMLTMFPLIVLLCFQVVQSQQRILHVKNSSHCPDDITECHTLDWYIDNSNVSFTSNTIMLFEEGNHSLNAFIKVNNCHSFTMVGDGSAVWNSDGLPQPTSVISCTGASSGGLFFSNSSNIRISNLELRSCSGSYTLKEKYDYAGSLVFISVLNIHLVQVVINNTKGYGLHTINTFGTNEVSDSAFLRASKHPSIRYSGNVNLSYGEAIGNIDTTLVVNSSWFMYGEGISAAGGLNMYINCAKVHVTIMNVTAKGNIGSYGGNLALFVMLYTINSSSIDISNSRIMDGRAIKGAGVKFWYKQNQKYDGSFLHTVHPVLSIRKTFFQNNFATITGGAIYMSYNKPSTSFLGGTTSHVIIRNCSFTKNIGDGAAMEIKQLGYSITPLIQTSIEKSIFENNFTPWYYFGPVLDFISVEVSVINCTFTGSNSTVISLRNSHLKLSGDIWFENNTATQVVGGALKLCEASNVIVHNSTCVHFLNNRALKGGAIYVQQYCMDTKPLCFIQPHEDMSITDFVTLIKFEFINNSAGVAGDVLYGGDIDQCSVINSGSYQMNISHQNSFWYSTNIFKEIFDTRKQHGPSPISSDPRGVCFCLATHGSSYNQTCTTSKDPLQKYPGEEFTVSVVTVGQMNGSTFGTVVTSLVDENQNHNLIHVGTSGKETSAKCRKLTYTLNSNRTSALIHFKPVTSEFATIYGIIIPNLIVHLLQCPLGFQLKTSPPFECVCNSLLTKFLVDSQVKCNISNKTISIQQRRLWFGCLDQEKQNQSTTCDSLVVAQNCDYYCSTTANDDDGVDRVPVMDQDSQCSVGHTGILCGACKPGYSRVLGGTLECQKDCTNANLPLLIVVFLASGILLVVIIMALNLTVTEGTLNGLLVYTTVIQTHRSYFSEHQSTFGHFCWVFVSWINLSFGMKTCLYNGMDGYQHIWALFAQAFYFLFIIVTIVLLSRRFIFFTRLLRKNIIKVLATLAVMLYSNLVFAIFSTFKYAILHISTTNGTQYSQVAWFYDGNVPYFGIKHAPLFVVALMCSIVMTLYVFSLLLIQCLQRRSDFFLLFWVDRFRPFFEAYTGPCRDSYRFWPGFLLFMRTAMYTLNSLIPAYTNYLFRIKMLITASVCVVIMSLACIFPQGVYKWWPINILEFSFFLNLCITSGVLGLKSNKHRSISDRSAVYASISITAFTFLGILVYHFYGQIKDTTGWKRLATWCSVQAHTYRMPIETKQFDSGDESASLLPQAMPGVVSFDNAIEH